MHEPDNFPLDPDRPYTPKAATRYNASDFEVSRGIAHAVIVLPSVYGINNSILLDALDYFKGTYRGVCVVDPGSVSNETLSLYHEKGVRGVRVNFGDDGTNDEIVEAVRKNAEVARAQNWVLQLYIPLKAFVALHDVIPGLGVRVVTDHFGHAMVGSRTNNTADTVDPYQIEGFTEMVDLLRRRLLFVKISAPYLNSLKGPLYEDMRVVAETIMVNGPEMVVYGSDWPHTANAEGNAVAGGRLVPQAYRSINDAAIVEEFKNWAATDQQIQRLFVDNPRRLWQWNSVDS
ncbi:uncharacterized protein JN550_008188 [Neoarthrinium moseri]|uniref:uncharacterized protein n=1 Tax=Neoarthrinium moseri TaxID=1658444 RepID=UPI001FDB9D1C|nr:uncharacterized protein JN550_008188 [Neoarthrinium moseri]KAI1865930.1 hypothetical protein JN550_008188 [Neoarthrinium moseri]